jgi:uncharacterized protein YodC (DUF2158 family)
MTDEFRVGDTVQLKSGGPIMTVEALLGVDIFCAWFDEQKQLQREEFDSALLKKFRLSTDEQRQ